MINKKYTLDYSRLLYNILHRMFRIATPYSIEYLGLLFHALHRALIITTPCSTPLIIIEPHEYSQSVLTSRDKYRQLYITKCYIMSRTNFIYHHEVLHCASLSDKILSRRSSSTIVICTEFAQNNRICLIRIHHCVRNIEKHGIWFLDHHNRILISQFIIRSSITVDLCLYLCSESLLWYLLIAANNKSRHQVNTWFQNLSGVLCLSKHQVTSPKDLFSPKTHSWTQSHRATSTVAISGRAHCRPLPHRPWLAASTL